VGEPSDVVARDGAGQNAAMAVPRPLIGPHAASPQELKAQLEANRRGKPYLLLRDAEGEQVLLPLPSEWRPMTVGRSPDCDVCLAWDAKVSRVHAQLERLGGDWTVEDDGLSRNGTFVNGERLTGRRRLSDGDTVRFGSTTVTFRSPQTDSQGHTAVASQSPTSVDLSTTQRRVLVSLCRPYKDGGSFATPATNQQIAEELFLSVDAVKTHLRVLFAKFGIEALPQNQKRMRLVERAFYSGVISERDL
jgi:FHA domain-containing protein/regulatory LuxR family protein